nr:hypothetical protein [Tanacetum cinerariifolium]
MWLMRNSHAYLNPQKILKISLRVRGMKKSPQTESEAHKNMMIYLKNTAGYKMDFFKGMTYAQICPIFHASINETPVHKATKRRKLSEEAQEAKDLRNRLEVVDDEDDDVFIKATPLARKVPVVDYQIVLTMFEKLDEQDAVWKNQRRVYGLALVKSWKLLTSCGVHIITLSTVQLVLLVERRYPLSRFTLEQMVNVTRLQVEEESEMSLELLRLNTSSIKLRIKNEIKLVEQRQKLNVLELMLSKRSKKNTKCVNAANEELTAAKHKLMLLVYCC